MANMMLVEPEDLSHPPPADAPPDPFVPNTSNRSFRKNIRALGCSFSDPKTLLLTRPRVQTHSLHRIPPG